MIIKREMPKDGAFMAVWVDANCKHMNACSMEWRESILLGFNDYTEYWEPANEEHGWFGLEEAYYILKEDFQ